jgi:hypothetical protein
VTDGKVDIDKHVVHVLSAFAVVVENVCIGQSVHGADPLAVLYLPATQATQGPPFGPVYPGLHTHCDRLLLATDDVE